MKKSFRTAAAALVFLALAACDKGPKAGDLVDTTFTATLNTLDYTPESKASVNGLVPAWESGDKVAVWDGTQVSEFTVAASGSEATLTGKAGYQSESYYSAFPPGAAKSFSSGTVNMQLPSAQTAGSPVVIAVGKADAENHISMKNAVGYIEVNALEELRSVTIGSTDDSSLAGDMSVNSETGKVKDVKGSSLITLTGPIPAGKHLIAVAPMDYAGLRLTTENKDGACTVFTTGAVVIERGMVSRIDSLAVSVAKEYAISSPESLLAWASQQEDFTEDDKVTLEADIDMSGIKDWSPVNLKGSFDGKGHKIYNFVQNVESANAGFFGTVTGPVSNVIFGSRDGKTYDGVSKITFSGEGGWRYVAVIARLKADLANVTNFVDVELDPTSTAKVRAACLIALANKKDIKITDCTNYGNMTADLASKTTNMETIIGGLASCCDGGEAGDVIYFTRCVNYGKVLSTDPFTTCVGGVLSNCPSTKLAVLEDCHNYGSIAINSTQTPSGYKEGYVGGVAGLLNGNGTFGIVLRNCTNEADLTVSGITVGNVGGIAGRVTSCLYQNCTNNGKVTFDGNVTGKPLLIGGITGGIYKGGTIENCTNNGAVSSSKNQVSRLGGIVSTMNSGDCLVKNCKNTGDCTIARGIANTNWQAAGGIVGFQEASESASIEGCTNTGKVTVSMENNTTHQNQVHAGGIIALCYKAMTLSGNVNTGDVSANTTGSALAEAGGIAGWFQNATSTADKAVCAVSAKDFAGAAAGNNAATITAPKLGGSVNGTTLTSSNLSTLAVGTGTPVTDATLAN